MKKFKHITVHEDTYNAFKKLKQYLEDHNVFNPATNDDVLTALLWDFEATLNLPLELRRKVAKLNLEYVEKRYREEHDPL